MRNRHIQRVACTACTWGGGRSTTSPNLLAPCFKCGGEVVPDGDPYLEERRLAGCPSCSWWGEVAVDRVLGSCRKCGGSVEPCVVVTAAAGYVLA